jgi:hypothetical protein
MAQQVIADLVTRWKTEGADQPGGAVLQPMDGRAEATRRTREAILYADDQAGFQSRHRGLSFEVANEGGGEAGRGGL